MQFDLGKAIRTLKAQEKITNEDIAKAMFLNEATISRWANNQVSPRLCDVVGLCELYGVKFSKFSGWGE